MRVDLDEIRQLCLNILETRGLAKEQAEIVYSEYLYAEISGKKSHGFLAFLNIPERFAEDQGWKIIREGDIFALIDGKQSVGQIVGKAAMDLAIKKAYQKGVSIVGMNNMHSYLMPGYYARMAAEDNLIGIVMDNARSRVAPYGGIEPKLGTNPIGIGIPTNGTPIILDMATSTKAMGEVRLADRLGKLLPLGLALDRLGKPTQEPKKVRSLTSAGGYKGFGLALVIEILAGALVQAKMGNDMRGKFDRGFLFITINPEIFTDIVLFKDQVSRFIADVKSSRTREGFDEILIPGENAQRNIDQALKQRYIEIEDDVADGIMKMIRY